MPDTNKKPKRRRRWLRYSLRTLFVVLTIFCIALGYWVHRANRQKAVVKWVRGKGGVVNYDFELDDEGYLIEVPKPPGPEWVRAFLGDDYLATVVSVDFLDRELKDAAPLEQLEQLEQLKHLILNNTAINDLTPLARLKGLTYLELGNTQVSDLTPLTQLTSLKYLLLHDNTQVSDLTPLLQLTSLKYLFLGNTKVSDLTPLMQLKSLKALELNNTQVTQEQINALQKALPNCYISWTPPDKSTKWKLIRSSDHAATPFQSSD